MQQREPQSDAPTFTGEPTAHRWRVWALAIAVAYCIVWAASFGRSPNWDEVWLLVGTFSPIAEQLSAIRNDLAHPPGPYILFRGWLTAFGATELSVRILVGLVALITLVLYVRLAFRRVALPSIAILGFSALYLKVGGVATLFRGYGLLLLAVVTCLSCWDAWNRTGRNRWLIGVAVATVVAVYSHYYGGLMVGALCATELLGRRRPLVFVALAASAFSLLPWMALVVPDYLGGDRRVPVSLSWAADYGLERGIKEIPSAFLTGAEAGNDPFRHLFFTDDERVAQWLRWLSALLLATLAGLGLARWRPWPPPRTETYDSRRFEHFLWVAVPGLALLLISLFAQPLLHPRFLVGAWPIAWLLVADLAHAGRRPGRVVAGLAVTLALATSTVSTLSQLTPSPLRVVTGQVAIAWAAGDLLVADPPIAAHLFWEWRAVQRREDEVWAVRTGKDGERPGRERTGQNVLVYRDLITVDTTTAERIWVFCARPESCGRISQQLSGWGYQPTRRLAVPPGRRPFEVSLFTRTTTEAGDLRSETSRRADS